MPDSLFERVRQVTAERGITLRELVVDSLERALGREPPPFVLRDAAAGYEAPPGEGVSAETIDRAIAEQRQPGWHG